MKKYKLEDLVSKGTHARKEVGNHIGIVIGDGNSYTPGEILDANAVETLINNKIANVVGGATTAADTLKEVEDKINQLAMSQISNDAGYV